MRLRKLSQEEIINRIKKLRKEYRVPDGTKLTQEVLAEKINVEPTFISKLENGKVANLNIDILQNIAEVLGVTVNDLCYEEEKVQMLTFPGIGETEKDIEEAGNILRGLTADQRKMIMNMLRAAG